jgi:hypothetical protein
MGRPCTHLQPETLIAKTALQIRCQRKNSWNFITSSAAGLPFAHETDRAKPVLDKK